MLDLPAKTLHAIEAVVWIALHGAEVPVSGRDIAERQGVQSRYLEPLMQKLVRAGILRGMRGPRGGYKLARERRRVTLEQICAALHETESETALATPLALEVVLPAWNEATGALRQSLSEVTLADLCQRAGQRRLGNARGEFEI